MCTICCPKRICLEDSALRIVIWENSGCAISGDLPFLQQAQELFWSRDISTLLPASLTEKNYWSLFEQRKSNMTEKRHVTPPTCREWINDVFAREIPFRLCSHVKDHAIYRQLAEGGHYRYLASWVSQPNPFTTKTVLFWGGTLPFGAIWILSASAQSILGGFPLGYKFLSSFTCPWLGFWWYLCT